MTDKPEELKYVINPLKDGMGVIFPEGTSDNEKKLFAMQLEQARRLVKIRPIMLCMRQGLLRH